MRLTVFVFTYVLVITWLLWRSKTLAQDCLCTNDQTNGHKKGYRLFWRWSEWIVQSVFSANNSGKGQRVSNNREYMIAADLSTETSLLQIWTITLTLWYEELRRAERSRWQTEDAGKRKAEDDECCVCVDVALYWSWESGLGCRS